MWSHDRNRRGAEYGESSAGDRVVVFGSGGIGLNVVQGARLAGAVDDRGVDLNPAPQSDRGKIRDDAIFVNPAKSKRYRAYLVNLTRARRFLIRVASAT